MKHKILLLTTLFCAITFAQEIKFTKKDNDLKLTSLPYYSYGKGLGITSPDSLFQFNIRFRMQNRLSYYDNENADPYYEAMVRRLRLRFDGFVGNPKFLYVLQLSFGSGDVGAEKAGENLNVIRDAVFYYRPTNSWQFGFGVTKLPGTRQTVNSSGAIQLTDRSINNMRFSIDRDFGLHFANINEFQDKFSYNFKGAISLGEGRNWTTNNPNSNLKDNNGLCYTAKLEVLPLGKFKNDGHYFEGDILREPQPKVMLSGVYSFNNKARKTQGQLGDLLYETKDVTSVFLDLIAKYRGWAFMSTYMNRNSTNPITTNPTESTLKRAVFNGYGSDIQCSYIFPSKYEIIGRYSLQKISKEVSLYYPNINQFSFGVNKYIWEHALKLQAEFTQEKQTFYDNTSKNNWYLRFQVELGI
ncbi:porin [Flavobacterium croceum]|uniref:porin n=1 Tax=Flavobacterium croceum TaxID=370975 RepID=UPI0024A83028|nr:porin [Flavobacterium croceum]